MHVHWLRLFVVVFQDIQCLLHFHYDVGRQDVEIVYPCIKFCLSQCFPLSVTCTYIHMPLRMYWPRLFFVVFQEIQCLHNINYDDVHHVRELYLSTKFHVCQCCG